MFENLVFFRRTWIEYKAIESIAFTGFWVPHYSCMWNFVIWMQINLWIRAGNGDGFITSALDSWREHQIWAWLWHCCPGNWGWSQMWIHSSVGCVFKGWWIIFWRWHWIRNFMDAHWYWYWVWLRFAYNFFRSFSGKSLGVCTLIFPCHRFNLRPIKQIWTSLNILRNWKFLTKERLVTGFDNQIWRKWISFSSQDFSWFTNVYIYSFSFRLIMVLVLTLNKLTSYEGFFQSQTSSHSLSVTPKPLHVRVRRKRSCKLIRASRNIFL